MNIGTKSVLFGVHCFFIHPWFVAYAWWKLYRFPLDPRLWIAFFVHDLGYIGKPNMDGKEGETHPFLGATIMSVFGPTWYNFTLYHSRFLAKKHNKPYSKLCVADKLAIAITPAWLYLPMANATGEINEYMKDAAVNSGGWVSVQDSQEKWYAAVQEYVLKWVNEHKDLKEDRWTPVSRRATNKEGVWR